MVLNVLGMKKAREAIEDAGQRVSSSLVVVAVIALVAVAVAAFAVGVVVCRNW